MSVKGYGVTKKFFSIALIIAGVVDGGRPEQACAGWILDVGRPAQPRIADHCFRIGTG
jgi:hypothetical protein